MDKNDKLEIRELITDILAAHSAKIDGKFDVIYVKLEAIEAQTTKTNGRVTKLETNYSTNNLEVEHKIQEIKSADQNHIANCPNGKRIQALENEQLKTSTEKNKSTSIWNFIALGISVACAVGMLIVEIITKT